MRLLEFRNLVSRTGDAYGNGQYHREGKRSAEADVAIGVEQAGVVLLCGGKEIRVREEARLPN